jgi:hypothetical protein
MPSWSAIGRGAPLPLELELRLVVGILEALVPLHTNLRLPPSERAYGCVCRGNIVVEPDGTVRLRSRTEAVAQPGDLQAPELVSGGEVDQQADLYAVGTLLLQVLNAHRTTYVGDAMVERVRSVAIRALRLDPGERWPSAAEFAAELRQAAGARLPAAEALVVYTRDQRVRRDSDRPEVSAMVSPFALARVPDLCVDEFDEDRPMMLFDSPSSASSLTPESRSVQRAHRPRRRALWLGLAATLLVASGALLWWQGRVDEAPLAREAPLRAVPAFETAGAVIEERTPEPPPVASLAVPTARDEHSPVAPTGAPAQSARSRKAAPAKQRPLTYDPEGI